MKKNNSIIVTATGCFGLLLSGCGPREDTTVVQEQPQTVIEKTTIKKAPQNQPDTVIVQPPAQSGAKVTSKTKTEVEVNVAPTPTPKPTSGSAAKAKPTPRPQPTATPRPTPTPRPKPTATPRPASAASSAPLVVRAEVVETSKVPDPKSVPYKEALVFTKFKVLSVQKGKYQEKEILVAEWAMKDSKLLPAARNRSGQVKTLSLVPLAKRRELESVMRIDNTDEFELEPYFAQP